VALVHIDIMDGRFCPQALGDLAMVAAVRTSMIKDVHLMIEEPIDRLPAYVEAGADIVMVHLESTRHPHRALQLLGELVNANDAARGVVRGLALNPGTPIEMAAPMLDQVDLLLLLAVNPGWAGQRFLPSTLERLLAAGKLVRQAGREVLLGVDGAVPLDLIGRLGECGASIVVAGSALLGAPDPAAAIRAGAEALSQARRALIAPT